MEGLNDMVTSSSIDSIGSQGSVGGVLPSASIGDLSSVATGGIGASVGAYMHSGGSSAVVKSMSLESLAEEIHTLVPSASNDSMGSWMECSGRGGVKQSDSIDSLRDAIFDEPEYAGPPASFPSLSTWRTHLRSPTRSSCLFLPILSCILHWITIVQVCVRDSA